MGLHLHARVPDFRARPPDLWQIKTTLAPQMHRRLTDCAACGKSFGQMARSFPPFSLRQFGFLAMLLPFLALSLFAQGVMPGRAADGTVALVLCTPQGPVEMVIDLANGQPVRHPATTDERCKWAGAQPAVVLSEVQPIPRPSALVGQVSHATAHILWRPGFDPTGLHSRGPPAFG